MLVALLIASLALVMLASMITSSTNLITRSRTRMERYYSANNNVAAQTTADSGTKTVSIKFGGETDQYTAEVQTYTNSQMSGKEVISYKKR